MAETNTSPEVKLMEAQTNRVDNFVQIELQKRTFANRYTKNQAGADEPIADFQSIPLENYQIYKPAWAVVRALTDKKVTSTLLGTSLSLIEDSGNPEQVSFGAPQTQRYMDGNYETTNANPEYISEYGSGGSYRPKPGLRNISATLSEFYTTINMNIKAFTRQQLNEISSDYLVMGKQVLVMFGYSDPANSNVIKSIVNLKNPYDLEGPGLLEKGGIAGLEGLTSLYSNGQIYAKIANVDGFDINIVSEDSSFDVTLNLTSQGKLSTYKPSENEKAKNAMIEVISGRPVPAKEPKAPDEDDYNLYRDFLLKLRGFPNKSLSKKGRGKDFILPSQDTIFTIGQDRVLKYTEVVNFDRSAGARDDTGAGTAEDPLVENENRATPGFVQVNAAVEQKVVDLNEGEASDKSLDSNETFFSKLFPNPESNIPDGMEQLVTSIRPNTEAGNASQSGNKIVDQMYITWGLCEWIINNGVVYEENGDDGPQFIEILKRFASPIPPQTIYTVPLKEETIEEEITIEEPTPNGEGPPITRKETRTKIVITDDLANRTVESSIPASHKEGTFMRSVHFPFITKDDNTSENVSIKDPTTMALLKDEAVQDRLVEGVAGKFMSTTATAPSELFSANPTICVLSRTKGLISPTTIQDEESKPLEEKMFKMKDLDESFDTFSPNKKKIRIRNILINADWFYREYKKYKGGNATEKSLRDFVEILFEQISGCFNGLVKFKTRVDDDGAVLVEDADSNQEVYSKIELDSAQLDYREITLPPGGNPGGSKVYRIYNQLFPLSVFGQDSIVRDINYSMDVDQSIALHFFYEDANMNITTGADIQQKLISLKKEKDGLLEDKKDTTTVDAMIESFKKALQEQQARAKPYLEQYLDRANRVYGKLIPKANSSVDLDSQTNILQDILTKIVTSADVVNIKKELPEPANTPRFPFKVEVTLDGISGIKFYDAFRLTYVPALYRIGHFKVDGISHSLQETDWSTKVSMIYVPAGEVMEEFELGDGENGT